MQNIIDIFKNILHFFKNPVTGIRTMPSYDFKSLIIVQLIVSIIAGSISSLFHFSIFGFLHGLIIIPIVSLITSGISTLYIYYSFLFLFQQNLPPKEIFSLVVLSFVPYFIFLSISPFLPPITLLGFLFSAILLTIGLVEKFSFPKKTVIKVVGSLFIIYILIWVWDRVDTFMLTTKKM